MEGPPGGVGSMSRLGREIDLYEQQVLRHKCVVATVPCLRHNPRTIVACSMGSVASDKSFFCRTGSTQSGDVQFVRVLHSKFAAGIRNKKRKSSSESDDEDTLRFARGASER